MKLGPNFYSRPAAEVAMGLIGKVLVRKIGKTRLSGMIVETEAYVGPHDLASHASKGKTSRTSVMFGPPGRVYVYMVYGVYFCLNAVTDKLGYPAAVLIRAIEPLEGIDVMKKHRPKAVRHIDLGSGPGKICQALSINRELNGVSLGGRRLWIESFELDPGPIAKSARIGVDYAGEYKNKQWRFFALNNPNVSKHPFNSQSSLIVSGSKSNG